MDRIPSPNEQQAHRLPEPPSDVRPSVRPIERPSGLMDDGRSRQRTGDAAINPYEVADIKKMYAPTNGQGTPAQIAQETDFEWKAYETYGKANYSQVRAHHEQGWRPVMHSDFPERFAPAGTEGAVRVNDMIFMHRPMRLTVEARAEDYAKATRAMQVHRQKMAEAPEGQAPRTAPVIRTSREAIEIPE
jgi:hypothetical protein